MTIIQALKKHNNDYSYIENCFVNKVGCQLRSISSFPVDIGLSVSVIIPAYKSNNTIKFVLSSLKRQTFLKKGGELEIIIVDDASPTPLLPEILKFKKFLKIRYIRKSKTEGAGKARDEAILLAGNDLLIFIDSDIVLPEDFISNHVFVHSNLIKKSILLSFRENVSIKDRRLRDKESWKNARLDHGDHRNKIVFLKDWVTCPSEKRLVGKKFNILKDSDYFKKFKANEKICLWNLPMMILTCAVSVRRKLIKKKFKVPQELKGWGFNDTCLFAPVVAVGAFVIPLLNSNVLHIIDSLHTKINSVKNLEYKRNEKIYFRYIKETEL